MPNLCEMPTTCGQPTAFGFIQRLLKLSAAAVFLLLRLVRERITLPVLVEAVFKVALAVHYVIGRLFQIVGILIGRKFSATDVLKVFNRSFSPLVSSISPSGLVLAKPFRYLNVSISWPSIAWSGRCTCDQL